MRDRGFLGAVHETRPGGTSSYSYNAADQLTATTCAGGTTNYSFHANGNYQSRYLRSTHA